MTSHKQNTIALVLIALAIAILSSLFLLPRPAADLPAASLVPSQLFDGASAMRFAQAQCDIGPRPTGTKTGIATGDYIIKTAKSFGWTVETQEFTYRDKPIRNVLAKRGRGALTIIGAHYDTRPHADNDPVNTDKPIVGANDGASGVAVLLELAHVLPQQLNREVWLAFFDAEDWGGIDNWPFSVGADHVAASLTTKPQAVIVLDMIGDRDLQIFYEANSNLDIQKAIFADADALGYRANFIPQLKYSMTDDHTPFLARSYPAVDLIDFDYPYWHTLQDTCDKISAESLEKVGRVMQRWVGK